MGAQPYAIGKGTRQGPKREQNEDHVGVPPDWIEPAVLESKGHLVMVADGMGGHVAGQDASRRAVSCIFHEYYADPSADIPQSLEQAIAQANAEVYQAAQQNPAFKGMGTTITAAVVRGNELYVANVGDSRTYLVRGGIAHQLTKDHSFVQEQLDLGTLTAEQARTHRYRNVITRSLGAQPQVQVDHSRYKLEPGDRVVLCSDGVSGVLEDPDMARAVATNPDPTKAAEKLLNLADQRGRSDDGSVIVIGMPGRVATPAGPAAERPSMAWVPLVAAGCLLVAVVALALREFIPPPSRATPTPTRTPLASTTTIVSSMPETSTRVTLAATATALPAQTSTATLTPTQRPTLAPTLLAAPALVSPAKNARVGDEYVQLSWTWTGTIWTNQYYDVRVWQEGSPEHKGIVWTQAPAGTLYRWRPVDGRQGRYCWQIAVIEHIGFNSDGTKKWKLISEESEMRCFTYTYSRPQSAEPTSTSTLPKPTKASELSPTPSPAVNPSPSPPTNPSPSPPTNPSPTSEATRQAPISEPLTPAAVSPSPQAKPIGPPDPPSRLNARATRATDGLVAHGVAALTGSTAAADVMVAKLAERALVLPGEALTFTIHYQNVGNADAAGVVVTDVLPAGIISPIISCSPPIDQPESDGTVYTWTIGSLLPSAGGDITITASAQDGLAADTKLENTAWISTTSTESSTENNRSSATVTIRKVAEVAISPGRARAGLPGASVTHTHVITNLGKFTDTLHLRTGSSSDWGELVSPITATLGARGSTSITVRVIVPPSLQSRFIHVTVITATSSSDSSVSAATADTTTVAWSLWLPDLQKGYCVPDPYEPNNSLATARAITTGDTVQDWFCPEPNTDRDDYFRLPLTGPGNLVIALGVPAQSDYDLYLYDGSAQLIAASNYTGKGRAERIERELSAGEYYIRVYAFLRGPDCTLPYSLAVQRKLE